MGPLLLILPAAFALGFALRAHRGQVRDGLLGTTLSQGESNKVPDVRVGLAIEGFGGAVFLDDPGTPGTPEAGEVDAAGSSQGEATPNWLFARLTPLESVPQAQAFVGRSWGQRLGLGAGEPWRLDLSLSEGSDALELIDLRIEDGAGLALRPPVLALDSGDPRSTLLRSLGKDLLPGVRHQSVLWGRAPTAGVRLLLGNGADPGGESIPMELSPAQFSADEVPRWFAAPGLSVAPDGARGEAQAELPQAELPQTFAVAGAGADQVASLQQRIDELGVEVAELKARRVERELAWHQYNRALVDLNIDAMVAAFRVNEELLREQGLMAEEQEQPQTLGEEQRTERERQLERGVRSLLALEGFSGLDLLVLGPSVEGGGAGPAVFRLLDDRGRLLGGLNARLLRLEASQAARTLTLVLEDGFESRSGNRIPFDGGARRLLIPYVDPQPWINALPELFAFEDQQLSGDDGLWNLEQVRRELNGLLARDTAGGWWRLHGLGGVAESALRDVQMEFIGENGAVIRRVFADRMRILVEDPGLRLILEDGAVLRGSEKSPFVDGSYRIFLPRASLPEWRQANLPGLGPPAESGRSANTSSPVR